MTLERARQSGVSWDDLRACSVEMCDGWGQMRFCGIWICAEHSERIEIHGKYYGEDPPTGGFHGGIATGGFYGGVSR